MKKDVYFPSYPAPLRFLEPEDLEAWECCQTAHPNDAVSVFCSPGCGASRALLAQRYQEITSEATEPWVAPQEEHILTRLFWPLRGAKVCYVLGYYLGTISLCGVVGEMVAILHFVVAEGEPETTLPKMTLEDFEKKSQGGKSGRIAILEEAGLLRTEVRNRYLHAFQVNYGRSAKDARDAYSWANTLVADIIGQEVDNGRVLLRPRFRRYLDRLGLLTDRAPGWATQRD